MPSPLLPFLAEGQVTGPDLDLGLGALTTTSLPMNVSLMPQVSGEMSLRNFLGVPVRYTRESADVYPRHPQELLGAEILQHRLAQAELSITRLTSELGR